MSHSEGEAGLVSTFEVGRVQRFKKGSGLPIQVPVVDLMEIGAGGGSIARISKMGLLQVGAGERRSRSWAGKLQPRRREPHSDRCRLNSRLSGSQLLSGRHHAFEFGCSPESDRRKNRQPLNTTVTEAAFGIHDLINETMAAAAKTHIAEKGGNPSVVTVAAFGGAGPVHAYGLARKIGAPRLIVPPLAGVGSALGFFTAPVAFDLVRSHRVSLDSADFSSIEKLFSDLEKEASAILQQSGEVDGINFARSIDMRFVGQGAETNLPIPSKPFSQWQESEIRNLFDETYKRLYGRTYPDTRVNSSHSGFAPVIPERPFEFHPSPPAVRRCRTASRRERQAYSMVQKKFIPFTVVDRLKLFSGAKIEGPAIIEEKESTIVIGEDAHAAVDDYGLCGSHLLDLQMPDWFSNRAKEKLNMPHKFDPIALEILWRRLISIVDEADASVARTAFSSLLRDAHDYTCMFTDSGETCLCRAPSAPPARPAPWRWE